jgi:2-phospho-L-lactate/phosphoenolpyruvate guanylyltransferase
MMRPVSSPEPPWTGPRSRARADPPLWQVVVPVRGGHGGKSRLRHVEGHLLTAEDRGRLALAMAIDTASAALGAGVGPVVLLTADPLVTADFAAVGVEVVRDGGRGLNAELTRVLSSVAGGMGVCALLGDLPALRPQELTSALERALAADDRPIHVPDWEGTGTALVAAAPEARAGLALAFGPRSAARHERLGSLPVGLELKGLRCDVDTPEAWARAVALGVGPQTARIRVSLVRPSVAVDKPD